MKKALLFFLNAMMLLFLAHCKRPEHPDPCKGKHPANASFKVEQLVGDRWFEGDTVITSQFGHVRFTANYDADSYIWKIGSETITTKTFIKTLLPQNTVIPVTLIVNRKAESSCFSNDDGIDTVRKQVYVWPDTYGNNPANTPDDISKSPYLPIYGTYYGESTFEPGSKKFVTLMDTVWTNTQSQPARVGLIRGIPFKSLTTEKFRVGIQGIFEYVKSFGLRAVYINMDANMGGVQGYPFIPKMKGYAWLDRNDWTKITIEYSFMDSATQQWKTDYFEGKRAW